MLLERLPDDQLIATIKMVGTAYETREFPGGKYTVENSLLLIGDVLYEQTVSVDPETPEGKAMAASASAIRALRESKL